VGGDFAAIPEKAKWSRFIDAGACETRQGMRCPTDLGLNWQRHTFYQRGRAEMARDHCDDCGPLAALAAHVDTGRPAVPSKVHFGPDRFARDAGRENVRKSQWYDHLLSTNPSFRTPTAYGRSAIRSSNDPEFAQASGIGSFEVYEPVRPGYRRRA